MRTQFLGWIGWAGLDTVGRLALLTGSTAVFSRLLTPHDFGITALVLVVVTIASVFVGTPFEEALAQRKVLRRAHLESALAASWMVGVALLALSVPAGILMAQGYHEPEIAVLLPVAMVSIFFSGHADIITGLARRLRRFNDIAMATLGGHVIGIALALVIGLAGYGLWALIAQRLLVTIARAFLLQWRIGFLILPRWSYPHLIGFKRMASMALVDRLADNINFLAFNGIVGALYGITALGYVNMAMRLIEPVRGAFGATGHNLAFSFFAAVQHDKPQLRARADMILSRSAFAIAPAFVGLAAVTPVLLPVIAGPGWEQAIPIGIYFGIGSAIAIPARLVFSALSAIALPEYGLIANLLGVAGTLVALAGLSGMGPESIGLARLAGDVLQAVAAIMMMPREFAWPPMERLRALLPAWGISAAMGLLVAGAHVLTPGVGNLPALVALIGIGVVAYGGLLAVFSPVGFRDLVHLVQPARAAALKTER